MVQQTQRVFLVHWLLVLFFLSVISLTVVAVCPNNAYWYCFPDPNLPPAAYAACGGQKQKDAPTIKPATCDNMPESVQLCIEGGTGEACGPSGGSGGSGTPYGYGYGYANYNCGWTSWCQVNGVPGDPEICWGQCEQKLVGTDICCTEGTDGQNYNSDGYVCCDLRGLSPRSEPCTVKNNDGAIVDKKSVSCLPPDEVNSTCCRPSETCDAKPYIPLGGSRYMKARCLTGGGGVIFPPFFCQNVFGRWTPCGFTIDACLANPVCIGPPGGGGGPGGGNGLFCDAQTPCPNGRTCVNNNCVLQCSPSCSSGQTCVLGSCQPICDPACAAGERCYNGSCCTPTPCEGGASCNPVSDGCGGMVMCDYPCQLGEVCNADGTCSGGKPEDCVPNGDLCGFVEAENGVINCGDCGSGLACVNNTCVANPCSFNQRLVDGSCCTLNTCQAGQCGPISDGCGGTINCGECEFGKVCENSACVPPCSPQCDGNSFCIDGACCEPKTCASTNSECGIISSECRGLEDCGACAEGKTCQNHQCVTIGCVPKVCSDFPGQCGAFDDGCDGTISCGTTNCAPNQVCDPGDNCCTPQTCSELLANPLLSGQECGIVGPDTCGLMHDCQCAAGNQCTLGKCVSQCDPTCAVGKACLDHKCCVKNNGVWVCDPPTANDLITFEASFSEKIKVHVQCRYTVSDMNISIKRESKQVAFLEHQTCSQAGNDITIAVDTIGVPQAQFAAKEAKFASDITLELFGRVPKPCTICSRTTFVTVSGKSRTVVPDMNTVFAFIVGISALILILRKRE